MYKLLPDGISWIITRACKVMIIIIWLERLVHSYSHALLGVITHSVEFLVQGNIILFVHSVILKLSCRHCHLHTQ